MANNNRTTSQEAAPATPENTQNNENQVEQDVEAPASPASEPVQEISLAGESKTEEAYSLEASVATLEKVNSNTKGEFIAQLKRFDTSIRDSMEAARKLAAMSIEHFAAYGDLCYAQQFIDHMGNRAKNFARKEAFLAWLRAFAPVTMSAGKLVKDKSEEAVTLDVEGALKVDFWEFAPETPINVFTEDDFMKIVLRTINKFRNEKHKPQNDAAMDVVNNAEKAIKALIKPSVAASNQQAA